MKLDMIEDEFDRYFARAALLKHIDNEEGETRRGSLPNAQLKVAEPAVNMRRTASCKYPARRRRSRSPRESSVSPNRRGSGEGGDKEVLVPSYATEPTLRAPSPGTGVKCHSAPHSRSSSWKKSKRPKSPLEIQVLEGRPRTGSVPLEDTIPKLEKLRLLQAEEICPVRSFALSGKGIVNRGDSFKRRSMQSVASDAGSAVSSTGDAGSNRSRALSVNSQASSTSSSSHPISKVLMLGDRGVGKSSLLQQFMTSEYMGASDMSFDDDGEITVSVLLDGEETTMDFRDVSTDMHHQTCGEVDAYVIVYSITDRATFQHSLALLHEIRRDDDKHRAIIMVANKSDLVRTRAVSEEEAKEQCIKYDCKYIEVSACLNHKVDELLVGIVKQIRLHPQRAEKKRRQSEDKREGACLSSAKGLIGKLFKKQGYVSKSCDNLLVL
jgi:Rad/Gem-related GTP binding protein 1